ncbi:COP9 signalosome complex subunit 5 [Wickerhamiella sorbophila]|uniref:COP9 signalosome complex subunit 5 n=1 Tax=Wickerhamiella sorbophila TaxID=45607 RepID=A0A2T0FDR4_9ASCO|nr:COP9 signalosome complex subunit 5 [Wickerhamiella sorbophila]PRT53121.1 COP9 signalosome complex subunit 5 [Wickerhamiella sorbophila]
MLYSRPSEELSKVLRTEPWKRDIEYFQEVHVSALALAKMATHAKQGKHEEIMGILTGSVIENAFVVLDCYGLPVEATETRVNAMGEAYEYMVQYIESQQSTGNSDNIVGWYHSHPGYGCWLSGIDVTTQQQNQAYQDPFLAIVVDPVRTTTSGQVDIGAFRTFPEGTTRPIVGANREATLSKYGAHAHKYYPLEVSYFGTSLDEPIFDLVWNRYWTSLLAELQLKEDREYGISRLASVNNRLNQLGKVNLETRSHTKWGKLAALSTELSKYASNDIGSLVSQKNCDALFKQ